jgi:hypothetical protein
MVEALKVTAGGAPVLGIGMLVVCVAATSWDALSSGAPLWALVEPIGVLQFGIGVIWFPGLQALFMSTGLVLFLVGSFLSGGYRKGYLPRQPRRLYRPRGRQKLPPF